MHINECNLKTHNCSSQSATCANNDGSYICECHPGFNTWNGTDCQDVDECSLKTDGCTDLATCVNTFGYFRCECPPGLRSNGTGCRDVDECSLKIDDCTGLATCENTFGSFLCKCPPELRSNGTDCRELDECEERNLTCSIDAPCTNENGTFSCVCKPGFTGDGFSCTEINECLLPSPPCEPKRCINEIGNYTCCQLGYIANRTMLNSAGIEECIVQACPNSNQFLGTVTDITNVLKNLTCLPGLALKPGVPTIQYCDAQGHWPTCSDIDECSLNIHKCTGMAMCVNTIRSYQCTCPSGFRSNGIDCEAVVGFHPLLFDSQLHAILNVAVSKSFWPEEHSNSQQLISGSR
ncbi:adhesion G protein-coupled receptor E2-like [Sycon ciliatum]|uniref:adhesion G protein-coupled receptor E2-like n=1 Tax=Sycon ciliatum TaxID=27933 RepID=UPI0031F638A4